MSDEPEVIEQVADENKVDPDEDRKKTQALVQQGLSQLSKTADNTGYAYVNLNLEEKELINLYDVIEKYQHLRYINASNNKISDISQFTTLESVLVLNCMKNEIQSLVAELGELKSLLKLTMRQNQMDRLVFPRLPSLEELNVEANKVASFKEFDSLKSLEKRTHVVMKSEKQVNVKSQWSSLTQKCKLQLIPSIHGDIITPEDVEEMIKEREEKKIQEEERLREETIKRAEEEAERKRIEEEEFVVRQKELLEQQKIEEALREEERIKQEEQRIIDEKEREEREKLEEEERKKTEEEEERKRKEEADEQDRLKQEQELDKKLEEEKEELQELENTELTPEELELQKQESDKQKHHEKIETIKKTIKAIPTKKRDQMHLFKNSQNPDSLDNGLTQQEIVFNFEKELDIINEFYIYQPIKKAFDQAKLISQGENLNTVQHEEFSFLLSYFKRYLEIMLVFQKFDINDSQSISKDEFLTNLHLFENIGIDIADPEKLFNEINTSQNDSLDFDELVSYINLKSKLVKLDLGEESEEEQD